MGRVLLSNNEQHFLKLHENFQQAGFQKYEEHHSSVHLASYQKLNVENTHFLKIGNDFIAVSGTALYKGRLPDNNSLYLLWEQFVDSPLDVRDDLFGCYCVIIKKNTLH